MEKQEKTVVTKDLCQEMTDAQREAIVYHSKVLNKYYESYEDMLREEAEFKRQNEVKLKAQEEKKARAEEVKAAYEGYCKAKKEAAKMVSEAEDKWLDLRAKFINDYHGYHMTYTNIDGHEEVTFGDLLDLMFKF